MPIRSVLLILCSFALVAAERPTGDPAGPDVALREELAPTPGAPVVIDHEGLWWQHADHRFQIADLDADGRVLVTSPIGPVAVERDLVATDRPEAVIAFADRLAAAAAAGLSSAADEPMRFDDSILTGLRLRGGPHLVIEGGVMTKVDQPATDRTASVEELEAAIEAVIAALPDSGLARPAQKSIETVLRELPKTETGREEGDEITPSYARRIAQHGWIREYLDDPALADRLESAIEATASYQPELSYRGDDLILDNLKDTFGHGGWYLRTPTITRLAHRPPLPFYHWTAQDRLREALTVIDFPADTDFEQAAELTIEPTAIRLYHRDRPLAWWTTEAGFEADLTAWRQVVPASGSNLDSNIVDGYVPPHLAVTHLDGDVDRIITAQGTLVPPVDGDPETGEAFLEHASEVLTDAAHLDLIGQYIFKYIYDSPDSRHPTLLGTKTLSGDIHQTALQTLATTAGGICRGDCDDLSELIQDVLERQGVTAHVISLPSHAAAAWAEEREGRWHVYVMQTGPTLEFSDQTLQSALAQAYKRFDAGDTFDPNGLGLLLRFSGENTRSAWRLSWRIFSEPEYAETMIDVQRDWHYQTYMEGIRKMEELIASGDEDTANYRELSGLFSFTGQYEDAAEYMRLAIERTEEADSRLYETAELIHHLLEAGQVEEAEAALDDLLENQLPPLREQLGTATVNLGLQLAGFLVEGEQPLLAVDVLDRLTSEEVGEMSTFVANWIQTRFDRRTWENHPQLRQIRRILQWHAATVFSVVQEAGTEALLADTELRAQLALATTWLDQIAFHDAEDKGDLLGRYAAAGTYYGAVLGEDAMLARLEETSDPERGAAYDHRSRVGGLVQVGLDLPWIRISPQYWQGLVTRMVSQQEPIEPERVARIAELLENAVAATRARDITSVFLDYQIHSARLIVALLQEDEAKLRELLAHVVEKDDKRLRDNAAMWIGNTARHLDEAWWKTVLQVWRDEVDYKPKYYWIAWRAALSDAPERALEAAALAAERFADDPAFVQEERFMRELLTREPATAP